MNDSTRRAGNCAIIRCHAIRKAEAPEFVLSFEQIEEIIDAALAARGASGVVVGDPAQPAGKDAAARGCLAGGYIATRLADGKSVRFKKMK